MEAVNVQFLFTDVYQWLSLLLVSCRLLHVIMVELARGLLHLGNELRGETKAGDPWLVILTIYVLTNAGFPFLIVCALISAGFPSLSL